jgi:hypothetical protein
MIASKFPEINRISDIQQKIFIPFQAVLRKKFANFFGSQCIKFDFFALEQKSNFFALVQKSNFLALVPENFRNHLFVDIYRTLK